MKRFKPVLLSFLILSSSLYANNPKDDKDKSLLNKMFDKIEQMHSVKYHGYVNCRINGKLKTTTGEFKVVKSPFKFYFKQNEPECGQEVLFVEGSNQNKALVKTASFPRIKVSLDPQSKLMRNNNHHSIFNSGYWYFNDVLKYILSKEDGNYAYHGLKLFKNEMCHEIEISNPGYKLIKHKIKEGETLISIANAQKINDYMIVEFNEDIENLNDYKVGQEILIPNYYAKKMILYLNKEYIPKAIYVYDHIGLYEELVFSNIEINPSLKSNEFSKNYVEYNF